MKLRSPMAFLRTRAAGGVAKSGCLEGSMIHDGFKF